MVFNEHKGFSQPDWPKYLSQFGLETFEPSNMRVSDGVESWVSTLIEDFKNKGFEVKRRTSENFEIITSLSDYKADCLILHAEKYYEQIKYSRIGHFVDENKKVVIVCLPDIESFLDYAEYYTPRTQSLRHSIIGMHLSSTPYNHIIVRENLELDEILSTIAHELTHWVLSDLDLPRWLDEGLATIFEKIHFPQMSLIDTHYISESIEIWSEKKNVQEFLIGTAWGFFDAKFTYGLAERIVRFFLDDMSHDEFVHFLELAHYLDGGRKAFRRYYEGSLEQYLLDIHAPEVNGLGSFGTKTGSGGFFPGV